MLSLFAAVPVAADHDGEDLLTATLTVDEDGVYYGCTDGAINQDNCSNTSVLTASSFTYKGTTYSVESFYWDSNNNLIVFDVSAGAGTLGSTDAKAALRPLTLWVQGNRFPVRRAGVSGALNWSYDPATDWTDGLSVEVRLTSRPWTGVVLESSSFVPSTEGHYDLIVPETRSAVRRYVALVATHQGFVVHPASKGDSQAGTHCVKVRGFGRFGPSTTGSYELSVGTAGGPVPDP